MAGPYTRLVDGQSADTGAQAITTVVNAVEVGLEAVEAALPGKAASGHTHSYDPAGSAATAQAAAVQRANHTGTQLASTISDFNTAVRTNRLDQMAAPTTALGMGSQRVTNVAAPSASTDAATKGYVDSAVGGAPAGSNVISAADYGVVGDEHPIAVAFTSGSTTIYPVAGATGWPSTFTVSDVGKAIWMCGGSSTGNKWHYTTISSIAGGGTSAVVASAPTATSAYQAATVGTDNTAAINTFFAAATDYDTLLFPEGRYLTQGGHALSEVGVLVRGEQAWSSRLVTAHNSHVITRSGAIASTADLAILHAVSYSVDIGTSDGATGWPTAGSGIYLSGGWSGFTDRCAFIGLYRHVLVNCAAHYVRDNTTLHHVRAAVEFWNPGYPDWGHCQIIGNSITSKGPGNSGMPSGDAAIWWRGSGGLMVCNNSIAGGQNMIYLRNDAEPGATGNILIANNSLEDWAQVTGTGHAVYIDHYNSDAGALSYISITGNVFQTNGSSNAAIRMVASSDPTPDGFGNYGIRAVSVVGNAGKFTGFLVDATRVRDLSVTGNAVVGKVPADHVTQANCTNVTVA